RGVPENVWLAGDELGNKIADRVLRGDDIALAHRRVRHHRFDVLRISGGLAELLRARERAALEMPRHHAAGEHDGDADAFAGELFPPPVAEAHDRVPPRLLTT